MRTLTHTLHSPAGCRNAHASHLQHPQSFHARRLNRAQRPASLQICCQAVATGTPPVKEGTSISNGAAKSKSKKISPEVATTLYRDMVLGREFEEMCAQMYYRGKMFGFVHLYSGQEAVSTGIIKAMRADDYICSTYRDHVHALSKGVPSRGIMAELFGKKTGICRGQGGSMHMFSKEHRMLGGFAFIGEGIPVGLGAAFRVKYQKDAVGDESADQVCASFFGDGTCNNGQFYECLNMASLYKLPCIFVVENNLWAIGMNHPRATGPSEGDTAPAIYKKGPAFGMPGVLVDGMDVLKVRQVAEEAVERARKGLGPTLIEAETYRFRGHSLADPDELRKKEEKAAWGARDPIPQFRKYALDEGLLTEQQIKDIDKDVQAEVEDAVQYADESPKPEKGQLLENVFADPKGFGIAANGSYRYQSPGFHSGNTAAID
ncbi:hypothetical protein WJX73_010229 [Symbiochloris irregularis]|uniref:Pyruvate dehydrogenase E1 component subunit alpha n=1 Tax=Symbiochloris irregularis TaxID=706552 RepID=A0AAW1P3L1_9CHLO